MATESNDRKKQVNKLGQPLDPQAKERLGHWPNGVIPISLWLHLVGRTRSDHYNHVFSLIRRHMDRLGELP